MRDAYEAFAHANAASPLEADDVERLALSAVLTGQDEASFEALERLHQLSLDAGNGPRAARAAIWLALRLTAIGEFARASGWLARAQRLVDRAGADIVERGYLRLPEAFRLVAAGDFAAARAAAAEAAQIGDRFGDRDLGALARHFEGRVLIRLGRIAEGLSFLDEAMLAATTGELSPAVTGIVYCSVIGACQQAYALDRAREWTAALKRWCEAQPQLSAFAGQCLIHRSEILQLGGSWVEAIEEARRASVQMSKGRDSGGANAFYQEGEIHRLRGEFAEAERAYGVASEHGRDPYPGQALLRLAQGRVDLAAAATRRVISAGDRSTSAVTLSAGPHRDHAGGLRLAEARRASDELTALAESLGWKCSMRSPSTRKAPSCWPKGDARGAVEPLRHAQKVCSGSALRTSVHDPRVLVAKAFQVLGDEDGAALELGRRKEGVRPTRGGAGRCRDRNGFERRHLRPEPARARGAAACRVRQDQQGYCRRTLSERENRRSARQQHFREAQCAVSRCRHPLGHISITSLGRTTQFAPDLKLGGPPEVSIGVRALTSL